VSRISGFSSPFLLGFDEIERVLDRVTKTTNDGYPPYNIERIRRREEVEGSTDIIRITLAVAGFSDSELDITLEENQLTIRGTSLMMKTANFYIVASPRASFSVHLFWLKDWKSKPPNWKMVCCRSLWYCRKSRNSFVKLTSPIWKKTKPPPRPLTGRAIKGNSVKHDFDLTRFKKTMSTKELADLGTSEIAYIRPMQSQEVMEKFPMVQGLQPGVKLWALFSASGDPLAIADDPNGVLSNAFELELDPVSLH